MSHFSMTPKARRFAISVLEKALHGLMRDYLNKPGYQAESLIADKITILNFLYAQEKRQPSSNALRDAVSEILDNRAEEYLHPDDREMLLGALMEEK